KPAIFFHIRRTSWTVGRGARLPMLLIQRMRLSRERIRMMCVLESGSPSQSLENTTMSRPRSAVLARTGPRLVSTLASACWLRAIRLSIGSSSGPPGPHGVSRCIGVCRRSGKHLQPAARVHAGTRFVSELLGRNAGDGCARPHVLHHHRVGPDGGEVANGDWT